jgi:hypothetical protein
MNDLETGSLIQRLALLEKRVRWYKFIEIGILAVMTLIVWATLLKFPMKFVPGDLSLWMQTTRSYSICGLALIACRLLPYTM